MKRILETSEVLGVVDSPGGQCEVCAAAEASYDEPAGRLSIQLDSFLRTTNLRDKEKRLSAPWLPKPERLSESVGAEEAGELARDIFHRWVRKVRETAPSLHPPIY